MPINLVFHARMAVRSLNIAILKTLYLYYYQSKRVNEAFEFNLKVYFIIIHNLYAILLRIYIFSYYL